MSGTLIVTADEKYELLKVKVMDNMLERVRYRDTVRLSGREGILCQNTPKNPEVHYGFQASRKLDRYFLAMYEGSMMRNEFEWCRLYVYKRDSGTWQQLIDFGKIYEPVWKYVEPAQAIVYYDQASGALLKYMLDTGSRDTLTRLSLDSRLHVLRSQGSQLSLGYVAAGKLRRLAYDLQSGEIQEEVLADVEDFSSIHRDYVLQTFFKGEGNQGIRLYQDGKQIAEQPFVIGNVNSFWNRKEQFYLTGEDAVFLMNPQLDTLGQIALGSPFIYNVLDEYVLAHSRTDTIVQPYLLARDLSGKQPTTILEGAAWTLLVREM